MHPTLALSVVLLSWCFFRNRSMGSRALLGVALALLGWEPATAGNRVGLVLLLIALGAGASMVWDLAADVLGKRRAAAAAATVGAAAAPGERVHLHRPTPRPTVAPRPGAVRAAAPPPPPPPPETATSTPERWTELDRADAFGDLLEANLAGLVDAYRSGDVRAQAAFAGEIADVARGMETMLRVVVGERYRVHGPEVPDVDGPEGGGGAIPMPPASPEGGD